MYCELYAYLLYIPIFRILKGRKENKIFSTELLLIYECNFDLLLSVQNGFILPHFRRAY